MELHMGSMPSHVYVVHGNAQPEQTLHTRTGLGGTRLTAWVLPSCTACTHSSKAKAPRKPCLCSVRDHMGVQETPGKNVAIQLSKLGLRPSNSLALCPKVMLRQHLCFLWWYLLRLLFQKYHCCSRDTLLMKSWVRKKDPNSTQNSHGISQIVQIQHLLFEGSDYHILKITKYEPRAIRERSIFTV